MNGLRIALMCIGLCCIVYDLMKKWNYKKNISKRQRMKYILNKTFAEWKSSLTLLGFMLFLAGVLKIISGYLYIISGVYLALWNLRELQRGMVRESKEHSGKSSLFQNILGTIVLIALVISEPTLWGCLGNGILLIILGFVFIIV